MQKTEKSGIGEIHFDGTVHASILTVERFRSIHFCLIHIVITQLISNAIQCHVSKNKIK